MTNNTYTLSRREIDKSLRAAEREARQYPSGWYVAIAAIADNDNTIKLIVDDHAITSTTIVSWREPLIPVLSVYSKSYPDRESQEQEILTNLRNRGVICQLVD